MKIKYIIFVLAILFLSSLSFATHLLSGGSSILWESGDYTYDFQRVVGCDWLTNERDPISPPAGHLTINGVPSDVMALYTQYGLKSSSYAKDILVNCYFQCDSVDPWVTNGYTIITQFPDNEKVDKDSIRFDSANYDPIIIGLTDAEFGGAYEARYSSNEDMSCMVVWHLEFNSGIPTTTTTITSSVTPTTVRTPTTINTGTPTTVGTTPTTLSGTPTTIPIPPIQDIKCLQGQLYNPVNKQCVANNDSALLFIILIVTIIGAIAWIAVTKL